MVEQKVSRNSAAQSREEKALFKAFLRVCPDFAGEVIRTTWRSKADPPDLLCTTVSGRRVGVEICQLAHCGEMSAAKQRERIISELMRAIGQPQPMNNSRKFWLVVFCQKAKAQIRPNEYAAFRLALLALIEHVDAEWPGKLAGTYYRFRALALFPPLDKYLEQVSFASGEAMTTGVDWIVPIIPTHLFDDNTMVKPMLELLRTKRLKCESLKTNCEQLYLLIAHNEAVVHGSPVTERGLAIIAGEASKWLATQPGPFNGVFFFAATEPVRFLHRLL